jgi:hypothetical protein
MTSPSKLEDGIDYIPATLPSNDSAEQTSPPSTIDYSYHTTDLQALQAGQTIRIPKNPHFTRKDVVQAFQTAFELVGGVPRLAIWANENYTDFVKLYARLLPSQASSSLGESNVLRIEMAIKPGALDE